MDSGVQFVAVFLVFLSCCDQSNAFSENSYVFRPETDNGGCQGTFHRSMLQRRRSTSKREQPEADSRVVGGRNAVEGRHPYMCAIYTGGSSQEFYCGGFLIHPRWVMTAAHCVSPEEPAHNAVVVCGLYRDAETFDEVNATFAIKTLIPHDYVHGKEKKGSDIALLELADPYTNLAIPILDLGFTCGFHDGQNFSALGFGFRSEEEHVAEVLQHARNLDFVPWEKCRKLYRFLGEGHICAGSGSQDTCKGDSGGPLLLPNRVNGKIEHGDPSLDVVVGIVSVGPTLCGAGKGPGIYTAISAYSGWIIDTTKQDVVVHLPVCLNETSTEAVCVVNKKRQKTLRAKFEKKSNDTRIAALGRAIPRDDCNLVQAMMDLGIDANAVVGTLSLLHWAASANASATAQVLINSGADVEAKDRDENTPLQYAAFFRNVTMVKLLLDLGADPDSQNDDGFTSLHRAALSGDEPIVKVLIRARADVDLQTDEGWTALHMAARNGRFTIVKLLLRNKADPKIKRNDGRMPREVICQEPMTCTEMERKRTEKHLWQ